MKYFKNNQNNLFADPSEKVIKNYGLIEISEEEFNKILIEINTPSEEDLKRQKIYELQESLRKTDHKDLPSYKPKEGEDLEKIIRDRDAWRDEIRSLKREIQ